MLSTLLANFKNYAIAKSFLQTFLNLLQHFEADYIKDGNSRDALLDDLSQYLLSLKSNPEQK